MHLESFNPQKKLDNGVLVDLVEPNRNTAPIVVMYI